ncbi:MAG: hypothetical protein K9N40_09925 [Candidatus Cloacimonetes bacterium]|nr:hypothetical protein [Candidatus Cloacimonadota bacterium]
MIEAIKNKFEIAFRLLCKKIYLYQLQKSNHLPLHLGPIVPLVDIYRIHQYKDKSINILLKTQNDIPAISIKNLACFTQDQLGEFPVEIKIVNEIPQKTSNKSQFVISQAVDELRYKI